MKRVFLLLMIAVVMCSCEPKPVREGRSLYMLYFENTLKDPSSLKIYNEEYTQDGFEVKWTVDAGAKNSYGGMVRKTYKFVTVAQGIKHDYLRTEDDSYNRSDFE